MDGLIFTEKKTSVSVTFSISQPSPFWPNSHSPYEKPRSRDWVSDRAELGIGPLKTFEINDLNAGWSEVRKFSSTQRCRNRYEDVLGNLGGFPSSEKKSHDPQIDAIYTKDYLQLIALCICS